MIRKEVFYEMEFEDVIDFVEDNYSMDDVDDVCEQYIMNLVEDEDEYQDIASEYQPFGYIYESMDTEEFKDFVWTEIVQKCEELDYDVDDSDYYDEEDGDISLDDLPEDAYCGEEPDYNW